MRILRIFMILTVIFGAHSLAFAKPNIPPELKSSDESLPRQNEIADQYGLHRIRNNQHLMELVCAGALEEVKNPHDVPTFYLDPRSTGAKRYPYLRPPAKDYLEYRAAKLFDKFGIPLKITSLARTLPYQRLLEKRRDGERSDANSHDPLKRSLHLTGLAFDISKRNLTGEQLQWLREEFAYDEQEGWIDALEEIENNAFHIVVFPAYAKVTPDNFISDDELLEEHKERCAPKPAVQKPPPQKKPLKKKSPKR